MSQTAKVKAPRQPYNKPNAIPQSLITSKEKLDLLFTELPKQQAVQHNIKRFGHFGLTCFRLEKLGELSANGGFNLSQLLVQCRHQVKFALYSQYVSQHYIYVLVLVASANKYPVPTASFDAIVHDMFQTILVACSPKTFKLEHVKDIESLPPDVTFRTIFKQILAYRHTWKNVGPQTLVHPLVKMILSPENRIPGQSISFALGDLSEFDDFQFVTFSTTSFKPELEESQFSVWYKTALVNEVGPYFVAATQMELKVWAMAYLSSDSYVLYDSLSLKTRKQIGLDLPKFNQHQAEFDVHHWIATNFDLCFQTKISHEFATEIQQSFFFKRFVDLQQVKAAVKDMFMKDMLHKQLVTFITKFDQDNCDAFRSTYNVNMISRQKRNLIMALSQISPLMNSKAIAVHMLPVDQFYVICRQALWLFSFVFDIDIPNHHKFGMVVFGESGTGKTYITDAFMQHLSAKPWLLSSQFQNKNILDASMFLLQEWTSKGLTKDTTELSTLKQLFDYDYDVTYNIKFTDPPTSGKGVLCVQTTNEDWCKILRTLRQVDQDALARRIMFLKPITAFASMTLPPRCGKGENQYGSLFVTLFSLGYILYHSSFPEPLKFTKVTENPDVLKNKSVLEGFYCSIEKVVENLTDPLLLAMAKGQQQYTKAIYRVCVNVHPSEILKHADQASMCVFEQSLFDQLIFNVNTLVSTHYVDVIYQMEDNTKAAQIVKATQLDQSFRNALMVRIMNFSTASKSLSISQIDSLYQNTVIEFGLQGRVDSVWRDWFIQSMLNECNAFKKINSFDRDEDAQYAAYIANQHMITPVTSPLCKRSAEDDIEAQFFGLNPTDVNSQVYQAQQGSLFNNDKYEVNSIDQIEVIDTMSKPNDLKRRRHY